MLDNNMTNKKGFTLIELLVVISIISLMSSIVLAGISSARNKAIDSKKIQLAREYMKALALYYDNNNAYPDSYPLDADDALCLGIGNPSGTCLNGTATNPALKPTNINLQLAPYIPGPPASLDDVMISGQNYRGIGYRCIGAINCTTEYAIFWVMKGNSGNGCAGGYVDNFFTPIGNLSTSNAVCIYTSDDSLYNHPVSG